MIPDYQTLMLPVLRSVADGPAEIGTVVERLAAEFPLTDEERNALLPSGKQRVIANKVHWAKTYLKQAGLVEPVGRGVFQITDRGRKALSAGLQRIDNNYLLQFPEFQAFKEKARQSHEGTSSASGLQSTTVDQDVDSPEDMLRRAHRRTTDELKAELIERIQKATPDFFERLIVRLLTKMGYGGTVENAGKAIGRAGDGGVDGLIDQDTLGLDRVYVQAKRYANGNNVGPGAISDFFGGLDRLRANKGVFVTTSDFSRDARDTAAQLSKRIVLIDGLGLADLMVRFSVGCQIEETFLLQRIDEDFFEEG
ncbi:MAG: restriction endonuclease [Alphaproteobacteria bacterium]|nr:restriction endonuclease [Alphaproteobacteria bacterium]